MLTTIISHPRCRYTLDHHTRRLKCGIDRIISRNQHHQRSTRLGSFDRSKRHCGPDHNWFLPVWLPNGLAVVRRYAGDQLVHVTNRYGESVVAQLEGRWKSGRCCWGQSGCAEGQAVLIELSMAGPCPSVVSIVLPYLKPTELYSARCPFVNISWPESWTGPNLQRHSLIAARADYFAPAGNGRAADIKDKINIHCKGRLDLRRARIHIQSHIASSAVSRTCSCSCCCSCHDGRVARGR